MSSSSDNFRQIQRDPLVETVVQQITNAIVTGSLRAGDKLGETQLGEQLGVSRGPVREAIQRLEQLGLVEKIPYRGAFVSEITPRDIEELHAVREALEGVAARTLTDQQNETAVRALHTIVDEMRRVSAAEPSQIAMLDADFHDTLVSSTENGLLNELWTVVGVQLRRFLSMKRQQLYYDQAAALHEPIVLAIAEGDADRAEKAAREHVRRNLIEWSAVLPDQPALSE